MAEVNIFNTAQDLRSRGFSLRDAPLNMIGYDPAGDGADRDGVVMISREEWRKGELYDPDLAVEVVFRLVFAMRMPTDLELPDKIAKLLAINRHMNKLQRQGISWGHVFCVQTNGVGYGIASALRSKLKSTIISYTTVARVGEESFQADRLSVPRLPALDLLRMLLELHRFKSVKGGPGVEEFAEELNAFVWRRKGRPEAMQGAHDDLVMPAAEACWIGSKIIPLITKQERFQEEAARATHVSNRFRM